jgi:hypothetical protein
VLDSEAEATVQHPLVTTAADIALLDLQCPWLCGVERRASGTARKARAVATVRYTAAHP